MALKRWRAMGMAQKESCEPHRTRSFVFRSREIPEFRFSDLRDLLELVDQADKQAMAVIEDVVHVTGPDVILILDEEVVIGV